MTSNFILFFSNLFRRFTTSASICARMLGLVALMPDWDRRSLSFQG